MVNPMMDVVTFNGLLQRGARGQLDGDARGHQGECAHVVDERLKGEGKTQARAGAAHSVAATCCSGSAMRVMPCSARKRASMRVGSSASTA